MSYAQLMFYGSGYAIIIYMCLFIGMLFAFIVNNKNYYLMVKSLFTT